MEEPLTKQEILKFHQEYVSRDLTWSGIDDERAEYLGDYTNVVRDLAGPSPDDWDLARAAMLHIVYSEDLRFEHNRWLGQKILTSFEQEVQNYLYYLTLETRGDCPNPQFDPQEMFLDHQLSAREATYYYSRAALAVLVCKDNLNQAIELFEGIKTIFRPRVHYRLPAGDDSFHGSLHSDLVLGRLPILYEKVGRFEDALNLTYPSFDFPGRGTTPCDVAIRRLEGWLSQLSEVGSIGEVERFFDLIYEWLDKASDVDEEERNHLGDCPTPTRQFWAWYYGNTLGRLLVARPPLRVSLLDEIDAGEWGNCWHIAGVLFETSDESWDEYRQRALKFYHTSDIEYSQQGGRPYGVTQPPHLSAQSDLYWAMRVGFADANSQNVEERGVSSTDIADYLEQIKTITSSTAQHVLRTERNTDDLVEAVNNRVIPNDEYWHGLVQKDIPDLLSRLPNSTVEHLIEAQRHKFAKQMDYCSVALCKSVESLFHRILVPKIMELPESNELMLATPRGKKSPRKFPLKHWDKIQLPVWSRILKTATEGGINDPLWSVLPLAFPNLDIDAVVGLHVGLAKIAQLRGSSSHDSTTPDDQRAKGAQELWDLVVGSGGEGFLAKFYLAFGLTEEGQESENADGC